MTTTDRIREQILSSFRAELAEHVQTLNDGLLAVEQQKVTGPEKAEILINLLRAAHSLKGASRAVGVSAIEQLAHALEDVLGALQQEKIEATPELCTACYKAIDAIQATQVAYEAGSTTPPMDSLQALVGLEVFRASLKKAPGQSLTAGLTRAAKPEPAAAESEKAQEKQKPNHKKMRENVVADLFADTDIEETENGKAAEPAAIKKTKKEELPASLPAQPKASKPSHKSKEPAPEKPVSQTPPAPPPSSNPPQGSDNGSGNGNGNGNGGGSQFAPSPMPSDETIRVSVNKLDALMAQLSELLVTKIHAQQRLDQIRRAQDFMGVWQKEWVSVRSAYSRLTRHGISEAVAEEDYWASGSRRKELEHLLDYVGANQDRMRDMSTLVNNLFQEYNSDTLQMALVIDGLEEEIKRVRMLPLATITGTFARMVRDLAQSYGKQAVLEIAGSDVELDKRVLEQIKDPLIHLLRNALDHGIESPEKRTAQGKPVSGTISLSVEQSGKDVTITVADDGNGLDIEGIRKAALKRNIPNAALLSEPELVDLIYRTGFSTTPIITDVSGRGVGMDVVRRNIENLHGRIDLQWKPGEGTRFILTIPLSLTSTRGLLVKVSDQPFAIPLNAIERILHVYPKEISSVGGHETLRYDGRPLMLAHLGDVLGLPRTNGHHTGEDSLPVVILSAAEKRMAFVVDGLVNEEEVVVKGLGRHLDRVSGIAGASVMGNGEVILILQVSDLIKLAMQGVSSSVVAEKPAEAVNLTTGKPQLHILVVDDSITTRTLEKNILEAAGYDVQLANDGLEAINLVSTNTLPDLIISDIAMPRLDGFELTKRLKDEERTSHIPVILVTSLDSPEDKAHGIEAGADAYIVKSSFDQNNLLDTIEQLI